MSVYVGIDVHRKRSQVAVIDSGGQVLANRNVPNGTETILGVIGGLPPGTPGGPPHAQNPRAQPLHSQSILEVLRTTRDRDA